MTFAKAGWAQTDITPPLGLPMGGRGPRYAPGNEILDPLLAQVLVLEDSGGNRVLWVSLDLIGFSHTRSSAMRYDIAAMTGVPFNAVLINFAHTHSGPMVNFEKYPGYAEEPAALMAYQEVLTLKILSTAQAAISALQDVEVSLHQGHSELGINRRRRLDSGDIALAPNPQGTYNSDLWVLDINAVDNTDRCVVFSIGCHPVIVYGFAWQAISADYPGACRNALQDRLGMGVHCQFMQGLAGNIRPRILGDIQHGVFRKSTAADHIQAGRILAEDVLRALADKPCVLDLALATKTGWVPAARDPDKVLPRTEWHKMAQSDDELTRNVGQYWSQRLEQGPPLAAVSPMEIGVIHMDAAHAVAWFSAEAVAEWLSVIRACNPSLNIVVWGYCQFVPTYLPTDALLEEGGYEVMNANMYEVNGPGPFAHGLDTAFTVAFRDLLG